MLIHALKPLLTLILLPRGPPTDPSLPIPHTSALPVPRAVPTGTGARCRPRWLPAVSGGCWPPLARAEPARTGCRRPLARRRVRDRTSGSAWACTSTGGPARSPPGLHERLRAWPPAQRVGRRPGALAVGWGRWLPTLRRGCHPSLAAAGRLWRRLHGTSSLFRGCGPRPHSQSNALP